MSLLIPQPVLKGHKVLVVGVANDSSIAYGCARAFRELGADLALTYLNEKARPFVEPLARELGAPIFMPLDVGVPGELEAPRSAGRVARAPQARHQLLTRRDCPSGCACAAGA